MQKRRMKPVQVLLALADIMFIAVCVANVILPVLHTKNLGLDLFHFIIIIFHVYAALGCHGYVKKISMLEDDVIIYDTTIPLLQVTVVRILELIYHYFRHWKDLNLRNFIILVILDVLYFLILLLDKGKYYYESRAMEEN